MNNEYDIIIAGGGASGLMLAASLNLNGVRGIILEKTMNPGTKILMSGGGRCNITHGGSVKDFIIAYGEAGPLIRRCLYRHNNAELAEWLEEHGVALADEKGEPVFSGTLYDPEDNTGRIFPASMKASDVLDVLISCARSNGWEIRAGSEIFRIKRDGERWQVSAATGDSFMTTAVVIATGGVTFPETGSDGSAFGMLRDLGVNVTELRPALAPIHVKDYPYDELSGISVPDVTVTAFSSDVVNTCKGKASRMKGDLLFTHRGFSGPVILNISRYAEPGERLRIQYNKDFCDLPRRMQKVLEKRAAGPSGDIRSTVLASLLYADDFTVSSVDSAGMVTAGGISLEEIDMSSMELKKLPGIYAIGEAINADGITGGYNLQMCWSTALTAADALAAALK